MFNGMNLFSLCSMYLLVENYYSELYSILNEDNRANYWMCCVYLLHSEFDDVLKAWGWPFIISRVHKPKGSQQNEADVKKKLNTVFIHLLKLQLPYPPLQINFVNF